MIGLNQCSFCINVSNILKRISLFFKWISSWVKIKSHSFAEKSYSGTKIIGRKIPVINGVLIRLDWYNLTSLLTFNCFLILLHASSIFPHAILVELQRSLRSVHISLINLKTYNSNIPIIQIINVVIKKVLPFFRELMLFPLDTTAKLKSSVWIESVICFVFKPIIKSVMPMPGII